MVGEMVMINVGLNDQVRNFRAGSIKFILKFYSESYCIRHHIP